VTREAGVKRCNATTKRGRPCPNRALPDGDVCALHMGAAAALGKRGGDARADRIRAERAAVVADLDTSTVGGIRTVIDRLLVRLMESEGDEVAIANCARGLLTLAAQLRRDDELEAEFEALRSFIATKYPEERERLARRVH
jgi:hypothetical protein